MKGESQIKEFLSEHIATFNQFTIRTGEYKLILGEYFKICYQVQGLTYNWREITLAWEEKYPCKESVPRWTCSYFHECPQNGKCRPPMYRLLDDDEKNEYFQKVDIEYSGLSNSKKIDILFKEDEKVLVVPKRLMEMRQLRKYTQQEVAERCGISKQSVSKVECGGKHGDRVFSSTEIAQAHEMATIRLSRCCFFAALYNVSPGYLMGQVDADTGLADIKINKVSYYKKGDQFQNQPPIYEEFELSPLLFSPFLYDTPKAKKGYRALMEFGKTYNITDVMYKNAEAVDYINLLKTLTKVYFGKPPDELLKILRDACIGFCDRLEASRNE